MGQIATKAFCNTLHSGAFGGDTTQCPTRSEIEAAGFTIIGGSYATNQLVQQEHIGYRWWEYTFSASPTSLSAIANTGGNRTFTVTSYKTQYQNSTGGTRKQISQLGVNFSFSNSNSSATVTKGSTSGFNTTMTVSMGENKSTSSRSGSVSLSQAEGSGRTATVTYSQNPGIINYSNVKVTCNTSTIVAPAARCTISGNGRSSTGAVSNVTISYSQTWGWNNSTTNGGTFNNTGGTISWATTRTFNSLGTTITSQVDTGYDITATVSMNGKSGSYTFNIYRQANTRTAGPTRWTGSTSWNNITVSASPITIAYEGGTSTLTTTGGKGTQTGYFDYTYTSGAKLENQTTTRTVSETIRLEDNANWASISGNTLTAQANDGDTRTVTVTATGNSSGKSNTCTITQSAGAWVYTLTLSPTDSINFDSSGYLKGEGDNLVRVTSTRRRGSTGTPEGCNWSASVGSGDFKISANIGSNGDNIAVYCDNKGTNTSDSNSTLTVSNDGDSDSISLHQDGAAISNYTYVFSANPNSLSFSADGETKTTTITSTRTAHYDTGSSGSATSQSWSSGSVSGSGFSGNGSYQSGSNNATVSITASQNTTTSTRSGSFTATQNTSGKTINVPLSQYERPAVLNLTITNNTNYDNFFYLEDRQQLLSGKSRTIINNFVGPNFGIIISGSTVPTGTIDWKFNKSSDIYVNTLNKYYNSEYLNASISARDVSISFKRSIPTNISTNPLMRVGLLKNGDEYGIFMAWISRDDDLISNN